MLTSHVVGEHVKAARRADEARLARESKVRMPSKRPKLLKGLSALRGRARWRDIPEEGEDPPRMWPLQIVFMLMSVLPCLLTRGGFLIYGVYASKWVGFTCFPLGLLGLIFQVMEKIHMWFIKVYIFNFTKIFMR